MGKQQSGFTLIEIVIVLALMGFVYVVAMPNFSGGSNEIGAKLGRLSYDVRAAYDMAVFSGKYYRLVFHLASGDYWLEETDSKLVKLGFDDRETDPTENEEKDMAEAFEIEFAQYKELAGEPIIDPESDKPIKVESPVLAAYDKLKLPVWKKVENTEWSRRSLVDALIIRTMQAEHHKRKISLEEDGEQVRAFIYFFPNGYVEKAFLHLYYRKGDMGFDEEKEPYTIETHAWEGIATIEDGLVEVDIAKEKEQNEKE